MHVDKDETDLVDLGSELRVESKIKAVRKCALNILITVSPYSIFRKSDPKINIYVPPVVMMQECEQVPES